MLRQDLYNASITITDTDGTTLLSSYPCDKMSGGDVQAKETKYRTGNGVNGEVTLGGAKSAGNITVTALASTTLNTAEKSLMAACGRAYMVVTKQPIDGNGVPFGKASVYPGILNKITPPVQDSMSDSPAVYEFEQSTLSPA